MKRPVCTVCVIVIILAASACFLGVPLSKKEAASFSLEKKYDFPLECEIEGKVMSFDSLPGYDRLILKDVIFSKEEVRIENVRITLTGDGSAYVYRKGMLLKVRGKLKIPDKPSNYGQFNTRLYYRTQGAGFTMTDPYIETVDPECSVFDDIADGLRRALKDRIRGMYSEDEAGLACAILTGDREYISGSLDYLFRSGGASHLLVISSLHLSILFYGAVCVLKRFRVPHVPASAAALTVLFVFVLFTGSGISAVRALCMFLFLTAGKVIGRTYDMKTALAVAVLLLVFAEPYNVMNSAFQLSFMCMAACVLGRECGGLIYGPLIYFLTLPILLFYFYELPLYGIFVNLVLIPLMPFMIISCIAGTAFGGIFTIPFRMLVHVYLFVLGKVSGLPGSVQVCGRPNAAAAALFYLLALVIICFIMKYRYHKRRFLILLGFPLISLLFFIRPSDGLKISFIDVGQGESVVIDAPGDLECLIDGGSSSVFNAGKYRILPALESNGIGSLEYVFISHGDEDHTNGISEILDMIINRETAFRIDNIVLPDIDDEELSLIEKKAEEAGINVLYTKAGDCITVMTERYPDLFIGVMEPSERLPSGTGGNGASMVLGLEFGDFDALFTGDTEGEGEKDLTEYLAEIKSRGINTEYELLKVAHHGSRNSTPDGFLSVINPGTAVISAGRNNIYGHPHEETMKRLSQTAGRENIFVTSECGEITVMTDGKSYSVETYLNS